MPRHTGLKIRLAGSLAFKRKWPRVKVPLVNFSKFPFPSPELFFYIQWQVGIRSLPRASPSVVAQNDAEAQVWEEDPLGAPDPLWNRKEGLFPQFGRPRGTPLPCPGLPSQEGLPSVFRGAALPFPKPGTFSVPCGSTCLWEIQRFLARKVPLSVVAHEG